MLSCYFENGSKDSLRHVVTGVIIVENNKVLLAKRGKYKSKPLLEFGKWALPGGYLDRDENLSQGIKREVKEEIGISIDNLTLFHIQDNPNRNGEDRQNVSFVFVAKAVNKNYLKCEEVSEIKWFELNSLPNSSEIAFDFDKELELYKKYLLQNFSLPIIG